MGSVKRKYQLAKREEDILYVLWSAGRPLLASEIANDDLQLSTVHTTLKRMMRKRLVEVVDFAKSGNVFGQPYATLSHFLPGNASSEVHCVSWPG